MALLVVLPEQINAPSACLIVLTNNSDCAGVLRLPTSISVYFPTVENAAEFDSLSSVFYARCRYYPHSIHLFYRRACIAADNTHTFETARRCWLSALRIRSGVFLCALPSTAAGADDPNSTSKQPELI